MIVLDASVLIAHMVEGDVHGARALEILDTEEELALHPMTRAECLVGPVRVGLEGEAIEALERLGVEPFIATYDEPLALARLRAETGLRLPDCCVLGAAQRDGVTLATFDSRLAGVARSMGISVVGAE